MFDFDDFLDGLEFEETTKRFRSSNKIFVCSCGATVKGATICYDCSHGLTNPDEMIYADTVSPACSLMDNEIYAHGVWAFNIKDGSHTSVNIEEAIRRVNAIRDNPLEVCASLKTERIGLVGVFMKGNVLYASNHDLGSRIDGTGRRYFKQKFTNWGLTRIEHYGFSRYESGMNGVLRDSGHAEIILKSSKVSALWVKKDADKSVQNAWVQLGKELNLKVFFVN